MELAITIGVAVAGLIYLAVIVLTMRIDDDMDE